MNFRVEVECGTISFPTIYDMMVSEKKRESSTSGVGEGTKIFFRGNRDNGGHKTPSDAKYTFDQGF